MYSPSSSMMKRCPTIGPSVQSSIPYHCTISVLPPASAGLPIGGIIDAVRIFDLPRYLWQLRQVLAVFTAPCDPWHFSQALRVGNSTSLVVALLRAVV